MLSDAVTLVSMPGTTYMLCFWAERNHQDLSRYATIRISTATITYLQYQQNRITYNSHCSPVLWCRQTTATKRPASKLCLEPSVNTKQKRVVQLCIVRGCHCDTQTEDMHATAHIWLEGFHLHALEQLRKQLHWRWGAATPCLSSSHYFWPCNISQADSLV